MNGNEQHYSEPGDFGVRDCALVAIATGRSARSLRELREGIRFIDTASIYFHFWGGLLRPTFDDPRYHNGFAIWAAHALHDAALAERLSVIDPTTFADMEELRGELLRVLDDGLAGAAAVSDVPLEAAFDFIRSQIVVFSTPRRFEDPAELPGAVAAMSRTSVFYHFIDARRRTPASIDDFSTWLTDIDREKYGELTAALAGIDPFYGTLVETREELTRVFGDFFGA